MKEQNVGARVNVNPSFGSLDFKLSSQRQIQPNFLAVIANRWSTPLVQKYAGMTSNQ